MIFRYGLQVRCSVINRGGSGGISGDLRRGVVESQKARDGCTSSCKDFRTNEGNPAPALCYLGQVVLQSSLHEHNTDLSVTNLQPQKESHWTKCVLDSSQWAVFCGQRSQKCNFWQKNINAPFGRKGNAYKQPNLIQAVDYEAEAGHMKVWSCFAASESWNTSVHRHIVF